MASSYEEIMGQLEKQIYQPVYLLFGDEPYFIDSISDYIEENVLTETEKEFNQLVVYGRDTNPGAIIDMARRYPMFSNYLVIIVKEAQDLLITQLEDLLPYIEKPSPTTLLVIDYKYKKIDRRKSFSKIVEKNGVLFESNRIYDNQVSTWIQKQVNKRGYSITPKASEMLAEFLGADLGKINNELGKLTISLESGKTITDDLVERNIGISKEYNVFELQNALGRKDVLKANKIVNYFAANPKTNPAVVVMMLLYSYFSKLMIYHQISDKSKNAAASALSVNPYFVSDYATGASNYSMSKLLAIISLLREYDLRVKGINNAATPGGELLRELIYKILH